MKAMPVEKVIKPIDGIHGPKSKRLRWGDVRKMIHDEACLYEKYLPLWNRCCPLWVKLLISRFKNERVYWTTRWQAASRWADYWQDCRGLIGKIFHGWYVLRRNALGMKLGIEMTTKNVGWGLVIAHAQGIVVNGQAVIGRNFHMTGFNCIGKGKMGNDECPQIGNNVSCGLGAKILGDIEISDHVTIGAGAVVVHSCLTPGVTLVGVPARALPLKFDREKE